MRQRLDLFRLNSQKEDFNIRHWIVTQGEGIKKALNILFNELPENRTKIVKKVSKDLDISKVTARRLVYNRKRWYHLPFLIYILNLWKTCLSKGKSEYTDFKWRIISSMESIKANNSMSKPLNAVKYLSGNLSKLAGAHAADGTLNRQIELYSKNKGELKKIDSFTADSLKISFNESKNVYYTYLTANSDEALDKILHLIGNSLHSSSSYKISVCDGDKRAVEKYRNWLGECFGLKPKLVPKYNGNMWACPFKNKVIARYFNKLLDFNCGQKYRKVEVPKIIRRAPAKIKNAFIKGLLTFEAGVGIKEEVSFSIKSKSLWKFFTQSLKNQGLELTRIKDNHKLWRFWSGKLNKEQALKWLNFFEPGTERWYKLYEISHGFQGKVLTLRNAIKTFHEVYPPKSASKICIKDVILAIRDLEGACRYKIIENLKKTKNLDNFGGKWGHSLDPYLDLLKRANAVTSKHKKFGKKESFGSIIRETFSLNRDIKSWKIPYRPWLEDIKYINKNYPVLLENSK